MRIHGKEVPMTPRMREGLKQLAGGDPLRYESTCVGRPTKQRLAKFGLAAFLTPKDWDGPMQITELGCRTLLRTDPSMQDVVEARHRFD